MLDDGAPEDQHIDAGIAPAGRGILRHCERRLRRRRAPGLHPGQPAGFQFGDDLVGDFVIEARPVVTGASRGVSDIAGLRDGRCEPLSQPVNPSRQNPADTLTLGLFRGDVDAV